MLQRPVDAAIPEAQKLQQFLVTHAATVAIEHAMAGIKPTPATLSAWYEAHKEEFLQPDDMDTPYAVDFELDNSGEFAEFRLVITTRRLKLFAPAG